MSASAADWYRARAEHQLLLTFNAEAHAMAYVADAVIREQAAEIGRLKAELDGYHGRAVLHCTEAQMDTAALASLDEPDGTILRATDTGRELVLADHTWVARTP